jgi:hypothetical protein
MGGRDRSSIAAIGDDVHDYGGGRADRERHCSERAGATRNQREPVAAPDEVREPGREGQQERPPRHRGRLELDPQGAARSEQQHLDGPDRRVEPARDLVVGEARDLAEQEGLTLGRGQRRDRVEQGVCLLALQLGRRHRVRIDFLLSRARSPGAKAPVSDVLCDREQPGARRVGPRAAQKRPVGVDERGLGDVLGVLDAP